MREREREREIEWDVVADVALGSRRTDRQIDIPRTER